MDNLHEDKRYSRKKKPKYGYLKKKLENTLKRIEVRKNKLSELRLEVAFLEKRIEMYKIKIGMKE